VAVLYTESMEICRRSSRILLQGFGYRAMIYSRLTVLGRVGIRCFSYESLLLLYDRFVVTIRLVFLQVISSTTRISVVHAMRVI